MVTREHEANNINDFNDKSFTVSQKLRQLQGLLERKNEKKFAIAPEIFRTLFGLFNNAYLNLCLPTIDKYFTWRLPHK